MNTLNQIHERSLPRLQDVTLRAVFRAGLRACLKLLMTFDALLVKCIRPCREFRILNVALIVAVQTSFRIGTVFGRCLVAFTTGN